MVIYSSWQVSELIERENERDLEIQSDDWLLAQLQGNVSSQEPEIAQCQPWLRVSWG